MNLMLISWQYKDILNFEETIKGKGYQTEFADNNFSINTSCLGILFRCHHLLKAATELCAASDRTVDKTAFFS